MKTLNWNFPLGSLADSADGSTMGKLFRGQALSDTALLAREAIQNSSDAAREFAKSRTGSPKLKVVFRFVHLFGEEKARAVEALDLRGLQAQRELYPKDHLQPNNVLDNLDRADIPLELLFVEDYGTHGLYGSPLRYRNSHLFMAMYYIGSSDKAADAGGSYGFGKSALQRASRIASVVAHTAFEPQEDDPVTSRLIGFTWWPDLQQDGDFMRGRASFGELRSEGSGSVLPYPLEDSVAAEVAGTLGFQARNPDDPADLGTSFLIVDPAIDPNALVQEVENWWWPALEEHKLDVEIVLATGETIVPRPQQNPNVAPFLRAFAIANGVEMPSDPNRERLASDEWRNRNGVGGKNLGKLALVLNDSESLDGGEEPPTTPKVALMRGPRMVVQYWSGSRSRVPLRGVFIASEEIDPILRETEPSSHDRWTDNSAGDLSQEATETARSVLTKIRDSVKRMATEITPPPPRTDKALGHFSKLMQGFLGDKRGPQAPVNVGGERIELSFPDGRPTPEVLDDSEVRISATFAVRVAADAPGHSCEVKVACHLFIHEDENQSQNKWPVLVRLIDSSSAFSAEEDGTWRGHIDKDQLVHFEVISDAYPNLWTTSLQPNVTRIGDWKHQ